MKHFLAYELAPFPLSLFTEEYPLKETLQRGNLPLIDGGFLLHKVLCGRIETFYLICQKYVT